MTECIQWHKSFDADGYGRKWYKGNLWKAHRAAWDEQVGSIPPGMCVLHKCDNPACVNLEHLFIGTKGENNKDRHQKGRTARGEKLSKLTEQQVKEIRSGKESSRKTARLYGINSSQVVLIRNNKTWRWLI